MTFDPMPFWVSFQLGFCTTILLFPVSLLLAWGLTRSKGSWTVWVEPVFSLPLVVSPTVLGFYLLIFLSPSGPVGHFFVSTLGLRLAFSFPGIVLASCLSSLPFFLAPMKAGFSALPESLWEASYTLGKGPITTLAKVILPNLKPALLAGIVSCFAHTLGEFGVVLMVGGSIPGVTKVVSIAIFEQVEALNFSQAQVYSAVLVIVGYTGVFLMNQVIQRKKP